MLAIYYKRAIYILKEEEDPKHNYKDKRCSKNTLM